MKYNKQRFVWGNEIKLQVKTLYIQSAGVVLLDGDEIRFEVNKKCCFVFQNNCFFAKYRDIKNGDILHYKKRLHCKLLEGSMNSFQ